MKAYVCIFRVEDILSKMLRITIITEEMLKRDNISIKQYLNRHCSSKIHKLLKISVCSEYYHYHEYNNCLLTSVAELIEKGSIDLLDDELGSSLDLKDLLAFAIQTNKLKTIANCLDKFKVPKQGLTLKQRIAYWYLI